MSFHADIAAAQAHLQQGRFKPALKAAKSALRKQPKSAPAANLAGIALGRMGDHRDAAAMFQRAAKLDPGFADPRRNLAQTLILLGQPDPAATLARRLAERDPGDAAAWYLLAQAEMALGRLGDAATAANHAVAADPRQARALNLRALLHDRLGRPTEAIADFRAALAINPNDIDTLVNISLPLARQLHTDEALAAVRRAVALAPSHVGAGLRLAAQLAELGDADAAADEYRRVLAFAPGQPDAIEQLAQLQDVTANRALEPIARAALRTVPKTSQARASLLFALAHIAAQAGDGDAALADANAAMAALLPYDAAADRALNADLLGRFPALVTGTATPGPRPIYVLGLPRSGTTLTEAILGAHPQVAPLGERASAGILLGRVISEHLPFDAAAIAAFVEGDRRMLPDLPDDTIAWVDKMPENYRLIGFLLTAYPQARIVHVTRDPRDTALSQWRGHFSGTALNYTYDLTAMAQRFNLYAQAMAHWHRLFPGAILDLSYEAMVADVDAVSRQLADFCGLDWDPAMARPDRAAGQVLTLSAGQLRQPVHARSVGKWRRHANMLAPFIAGLDPGLWPGIGVATSA
jgi:tetratricopeptide (TPR) repeat protein